jgi:hypothetical protein
MEWIWFVGLVAVVIAIVMAITKYFDKKRTAALMQLSMEMGFHYDHDGEPIDPAAKAAIHLFDQGHSKEIHHILRGTAAGSDAVLFDYTYIVGYGRSQQVYNQTVAAYRFDPHAPAWQLAPEGFFQKLGTTFGMQDIDFDTNKDFSDRYLLRGPDEAAIRAFFHPGLLAYFESLDRKNKWHVETGGGWIVFYVSQKKRKPPELRAFLDETSQMYSAIKSNMSSSAFGRGA